MKKFSLVSLFAFSLMTLASFGRNLQAGNQQEPSEAQESDEISISIFEPWFEIQFEKDSLYSYALGIKFDEIDGQTRKITTSRLYKNGYVLDEHSHGNLVNHGAIHLDTLFRYVPFEGLNEMGILISEGDFCGSKKSKILFGRSGNKLLKEIVLDQESEGEGIVPGTFTSMEFEIDLVKKELVIQTTKGYDYASKDEKSAEKIYYSKDRRCILNGNEFKFKNHPKPDYRYVVAENGLSMRSDPFLSSARKGSLSYGEKVRVVEVTDLSMSVQDGRHILDGMWVEIEYPDGTTSGNTFVFDGYLSKVKPALLSSKE